MNTRPKNILFIIHRLYFNGTPKKGGIDRIVAFLSKKHKTTLIEHPFEVINHPSTISSGVNHRAYRSKTRGPLLWIEELFINLYWIVSSKQKYHFAIASDPLNFFSCHVLKLLGKVKKTQFHSTDYSNPRFTNWFLESIYQFLYSYAVKNADMVTVVSTRMKERIERDVFLLPNSPNFQEIPKVPPDNKKKADLVLLVGRWGKQINSRIILQTLKSLKKAYPKITLHIIGYVGKGAITDKNIIFHGPLTYEDAIKEMSQMYIGITAYTSSPGSYVHFADSLKIREYAAAGLPIVCDSIYATSEEVQKNNAGIVYKTSKDMINAITHLIEDREDYNTMRKNALSWAKKNDKKLLLQKLYKNL